MNKKMKFKACRSTLNRSLLKVNEDLKDKRNAEIRFLVIFLIILLLRTRPNLYIQSNDADCALSQPTKGLSECVRCKALGFKAKGVYFCVLD